MTIPSTTSNARGASPTNSEDGYRSLLEGSRAMRRDHAIARDSWLAGLQVDRKVDLLFELECLLKGLACFANPRNHVRAARKTASVAVDFREPMRVVREGIARILEISRILLHQEERAFIFQRYLEHVIPEDTARTKFVRATESQETPEDSLLALRHGFTHLAEVVDVMCKVERFGLGDAAPPSRAPQDAGRDKLGFRTFYALLGLVQREIARNTFFNPIRALEFRPEFDRIKSAEVLEVLRTVQGDSAQRLVALCFLSLFRQLRYLALIEKIAVETNPVRAYVILAAIRSDSRALATHLRSHAGSELSEGYERELFAVGARAMMVRYESLLAEGHRLLQLRGALEGIAAKVTLELRRMFERELPVLEDRPPPMELRRRMLAAADGLRPALQSTILLLCKSLGSRLDAHFVFDDEAAKREVGERLRRDVWMFAQIVRAFAAKASVVRPGDKSDRWASVETFRFVKEFLHYFGAMGYPLLRENDYPRFDQFIAAMSSLEETDLLDPARFKLAVEECGAFYSFLLDVFESISRREELAGTPFDRRAAAEGLRLYLSETR